MAHQIKRCPDLNVLRFDGPGPEGDHGHPGLPELVAAVGRHPVTARLPNTIGNVEQVLEAAHRGHIDYQTLKTLTVRVRIKEKVMGEVMLEYMLGVTVAKAKEEADLAVLHHEPAGQHGAVVMAPQTHPGDRRFQSEAEVEVETDPLMESQVSVGGQSQNFLPVLMKMVFTWEDES